MHDLFTRFYAARIGLQHTRDGIRNPPPQLTADDIRNVIELTGRAYDLTGPIIRSLDRGVRPDMLIASYESAAHDAKANAASAVTRLTEAKFLASLTAETQ